MEKTKSVENDDDPTRERGTISKVFRGNEDHGIMTCSITVNFRGGSVQGFGNLSLDGFSAGGVPLAEDFVRDLCHVFGVRTLEELVGKECYALRCFRQHNTLIEGLQAMNGSRFVITAWRRKHFPDAPDPLEERRESLRSTMEWAMRRYRDAEAELKTVEREYTAWPARPWA